MEFHHQLEVEGPVLGQKGKQSARGMAQKVGGLQTACNKPGIEKACGIFRFK
jgi:hypothetical protein